MSSNPEKKRKLLDKDVNCRLRHGLNVHCLAHIFQYLNSVDMYTVGAMNVFHKQIINDLVIPKHTVNFSDLLRNDITILQVFERYGTRIRKFYFDDWDLFGNLIQLIRQYCSTDQLKCIQIDYGNKCNVQLPIQFRNVEKFIYRGCSGPTLSMDLSESLRYLNLSECDLDPNFDWTKLKNLRELYLSGVNGINVQNFIKFLRHRPKIEVFHHKGLLELSGGTIEDICEAMAIYCGNKIRDYHGVMDTEDEILPLNLFNFVSGFTNVKKVFLESKQICCGDLIDAMKRLAENDTIEMLQIRYESCYRFLRSNENCNFQETPNLNGFDMRHFSNLKTLHITGCFDDVFLDLEHGQVCDEFKLLNVYGPQILSNVENLTIESWEYNCDFIKYAVKLRHLCFNGRLDKFSKGVHILSTVKNILRKRNNRPNQDDFIEIKLGEDDDYPLRLMAPTTS